MVFTRVSKSSSFVSTDVIFTYVTITDVNVNYVITCAAMTADVTAAIDIGRSNNAVYYNNNLAVHINNSASGGNRSEHCQLSERLISVAYFGLARPCLLRVH